MVSARGGGGYHYYLPPSSWGSGLLGEDNPCKDISKDSNGEECPDDEREEKKYDEYDTEEVRIGVGILAESAEDAGEEPL